MPHQSAAAPKGPDDVVRRGAAGHVGHPQRAGRVQAAPHVPGLVRKLPGLGAGRGAGGAWSSGGNRLRRGRRRLGAAATHEQVQRALRVALRVEREQDARDAASAEAVPLRKSP